MLPVWHVRPATVVRLFASAGLFFLLTGGPKVETPEAPSRVEVLLNQEARIDEILAEKRDELRWLANRGATLGELIARDMSDCKGPRRRDVERYQDVVRSVKMTTQLIDALEKRRAVIGAELMALTGRPYRPAAPELEPSEFVDTTFYERIIEYPRMYDCGRE